MSLRIFRKRSFKRTHDKCKFDKKYLLYLLTVTFISGTIVHSIVINEKVS